MSDDFDKDGNPVRFQPHLFTFFAGAPYRYIDNLPPEWSYWICKCDRFFWASYKETDLESWHTQNRSPHRCGVCKKVNIMDFFECSGCEKMYIKNFSHPGHCNAHHPLCWDCLTASEWEPCCDMNAWRRRNLSTGIRPPRGKYEPIEIKPLSELYEEEIAEFSL